MADSYGYGRDLTDEEVIAIVGATKLWEWRRDYREYAEDHLGWVPLWQPFLQDRLEEHFNVKELLDV